VYAGIVVLLLFQAAPQTVSSPVADELRRGKISFDRGEYARAIEILRPLLYPEIRLESEGQIVQATVCWEWPRFFRETTTQPPRSSASSCNCSPTTVSIPCWIRPR